MSVSAMQAARFYEEVVCANKVFTFDDGDGLDIYTIHGQEVTPFWSSRTRLLKIQATHPKYAGRQIKEESMSAFMEETLPMLEKEGIQVGVKWSGPRLAGYDMPVADLRKNLQFWIDRNNNLSSPVSDAPPPMDSSP